MNRVLQIAVLLPAILFITTGVRWMVAPESAAPQFGITLGTGVELSSQIGDMAGFFLTLGVCMLLALVTQRRTWYYPAIMLLAITAVGRVVAWLVHDATFAIDLIAPEVVISILLLLASRRLAKAE